MGHKKGVVFKLKTWCVQGKGIDFAAKCKASDLMDLFYLQYPDEKRCRSIHTFKQRYHVFSLTDKELEHGITYIAEERH